MFITSQKILTIGQNNHLAGVFQIQMQFPLVEILFKHSRKSDNCKTTTTPENLTLLVFLKIVRRNKKVLKGKQGEIRKIHETFGSVRRRDTNTLPKSRGF